MQNGALRGPAIFAFCFKGASRERKRVPEKISWTLAITGADFRTRTGDPILTMDVLYLLS